MIFSNDRTEIRRTFQTAWRKFREGKPLEPLEALIADVVVLHPEYHRWLEEENALERDWFPEDGVTNPFMHLGMHIAIQEQITTNRPDGIAEAYREALVRKSDPHAIQHRFMECLGEILWQAQRANSAPDEAAYLRCIYQRT